MAPIGRPPSDPAKRKAYNKAKDTPTPYQEGIDDQKERSRLDAAQKKPVRSI